MVQDYLLLCNCTGGRCLKSYWHGGVQWPQALHRSLRHGGDVALECLPDIDKNVGKEPGLAKAGHLTQESRYATAQADFRQQRSAPAAELADSTVEAKASTQSEAARKTA